MEGQVLSVNWPDNEEALDNSPEEYKDSITLSFIEKPVIVWDGRSYENDSIKEAQRHTGRSPITPDIYIGQSPVVINKNLAKAMNAYIQENFGAAHDLDASSSAVMSPS